MLCEYRKHKKTKTHLLTAFTLQFTTFFFIFTYAKTTYSVVPITYTYIVCCTGKKSLRSGRKIQRLPETTPHKPLSHPQLPLKQLFQATSGLLVKLDKIQQYEISMPADVSIETVSQPDNNPQQSVRSKTAQLATHTQNVPPSAVSWHQSGTCSSASAQHQPSAHALGQDKPFYGLPTTGHQSSVNPHQSKVLTISSRTNLHDNVTTIQASSNMANRMPTDMSPSPNGLYLLPALTVPPKVHIPAYPGMIQAPSMYTSPCDLHYPTCLVIQRLFKFLLPSAMMCQMLCTQGHLTHSCPQHLLSCLEPAILTKQTPFNCSQRPMIDSTPHIRTVLLCHPPLLLCMLL